MPSGWLDALDEEVAEDERPEPGAASSVEEAAEELPSSRAASSRASSRARGRGRGRAGRPCGSVLVRQKRKPQKHEDATDAAMGPDLSDLRPIEKARRVLAEKRAMASRTQPSDKRPGVVSGLLPAFAPSHRWLP